MTTTSILRLPYENVGRIAYNSDIDSIVMNDILRKLNINNKFVLGLVNVLLDRGDDWSPVIVYNIYDIVKKDGMYYMSLRDENLNYPVSNTEWWREVSQASIPTWSKLDTPNISAPYNKITVNDSISFNLSNFDENATSIIWNIVGAYEVVDGAISGSTLKSIRLKATETGVLQVKAKVISNKVGYVDSDFSNVSIITVEAAAAPEPIIVNRDTSLYDTQSYAEVTYTETIEGSFLSFDKLSAFNNLSERMFITFGDVSASISFDSAYLGKEFVVTCNGVDFTGIFETNTSFDNRKELALRGVQVQRKMPPASEYVKPEPTPPTPDKPDKPEPTPPTPDKPDKPDKPSTPTFDDNYNIPGNGISNGGYESGIGYTDPMTDNTYLRFNTKTWDNSVPAEIMFFKFDEYIGKLDFAGEYIGNSFAIYTKDKEHKWVGTFAIQEDYSNPVILTKVRVGSTPVAIKKPEPTPPTPVEPEKPEPTPPTPDKPEPTFDDDYNISGDGVVNGGYESGIGYTEPISDNTYLRFNTKRWDNSIPAEIMFFKLVFDSENIEEPIIGKLDFATEYAGESFAIYTKDKVHKWTGTFATREEYNNPVILTKVR